MVIHLEEVVDGCSHGMIRELGCWPDTKKQLYLCMDCKSSITEGQHTSFSIGDYRPACYVNEKDQQGRAIIRWVYQKIESVVEK